ncbi:S1 RNA-binding domain-containing protein [Lentzea californiensis]|uniref:S1 RNA-binding domain-containing protein n=1 Tax=Lentzea californiensis TaxID=438851 RepID=UPI00216525AA|nr:S1 RNA-binding domain-containing protein [Lentzea californiensis]MCR3753240.1 small subunit ribosomal protein S1 [Lentzea californiensis]
MVRVSPHERWLEMVREHPELHEFLSGLRLGEVLSGTVAAVENFGVFVRLDGGPAHPSYPGVGFVTIPNLSWHHVDDLSDVVAVGQRVSGKFLEYDTLQMEARMSLRALQPDPFQAFADAVTAGQEFRGPVTMRTPIGMFVLLADGVEGLLPDVDLAVGDEVSVVVTEIDRERRRVVLASGRG